MRNKWNSFTSKCKYVWKRYLHGTKGLISLFLAFIMTPTLSIMLLLTETSRYQSTFELMNELMDCSMLSAQANYDSYVEERFGLLSYDQQKESPGDLFVKYMDQNDDALGNAVTMGNALGIGTLPLSNDDVFKQQISEYAGLTGFLEAGTSVLNVEDFLKTLKTDNPLEKLRHFSDTVSNGSKTLKSMGDLIEAVKKSVDKVNKYQENRNDYNQKASDFRTKADKYINALEDAEKDLKSDDDHDKIYSDEDVKKAKKEADTARDEYKKSGEKLSSSMDDARKELVKVSSLAASAVNNVEKTKTSLDELKNYGAKTELLSNSITKLGDDIFNALGEIVDENWSSIVISEIQIIKDQTYSIKHTEFGKNNGTEGQNYINESTSIDSDWFTGKYNAKNLSSIPNNLGDVLAKICESFMGKNEISDDTKADINDIIDLIGNMAGVSFLYDNHLNAVVSGGTSDLGASARTFITALDMFIDAGNNFSGKNSEGKSGLAYVWDRIVGFFRGLCEVFSAIAFLIISIVAILGEILWNLAGLLGGKNNFYYTLLLPCYSVYNCPNRVTWETESSLSGYKYKDIYTMVGPGPNSGPSGAFANMGNLFASAPLAGNSADSAEAFRGAEGEYILAGTSSEITNQVLTALYLYVLRLGLDFITFMKHQDLSDVASKLSGPWGMILKVVLIICEPMIDTFLLVNGGDIPFLKSEPYLSLSGAKNLSKKFSEVLIAAGKNAVKETGSDIAKMSNLGEGTEKDLGNKIKTKFGADLTKKKKTLSERMKKFGEEFELGYSDYLFLLILLTRTEGEMCDRLQDLVRMESMVHYDKDFTLDKCFTALEGRVEYDLNGMFRLERLNDGNPYKVKLKRTATY